MVDRRDYRHRTFRAQGNCSNLIAGGAAPLPR